MPDMADNGQGNASNLPGDEVLGMLGGPPPTKQMGPAAAPATLAQGVQGTPAPPPEGRASRFFRKAEDLLGGVEEQPVVDQQTGAVSSQKVRLGGGAWARKMIAGMLTGMASASEAPIRPGAGALSGVGAGFAGEQGRQDALRQRKINEGQRGFENQKQAQAAKDTHLAQQAMLSHLSVENAAAAFALQRAKVTASSETITQYNDFQKALGANEQNVDLGILPATNLGDFTNGLLALEKQNPQLKKLIATGQVFSVPAFDASGNLTGVHAAIVRKDVQQMPIRDVFGMDPVTGAPKEIPPLRFFVPGKMDPKTGKPGEGQWKEYEPPDDLPYGSYMLQMLATSKDAHEADLQRTEAEKNVAEAGAARATAGAETARAQNLRAQTQQLLTGGIDELGRPLESLPQKERLARYKTFSQSYVKDINQLDQSYSQMQSIMDRAAKGQMTGADSVVGLFNAIGISSAPLKGRGFRINQSIVGEHAGARNVYQDMATKLSRIAPDGTGEIVTPKQLQDYTAIMSQARHDLYVTAAREARRQKLPVDFLPQGNNQPIDLGTARIFMDVYNGNKDDARAAATKFGWTVPQ